jgi:hypothetical protein
VSLPDVENALLEVLKHADLHFIEEVGLRGIAHNTGNASKHVYCSVDVAR